MKPPFMNTHLEDDRYGTKGIRAATARNRGRKAGLSIIAALSLFATLGLAARSHRTALAQGEVQTTENKVVPNAMGQGSARPAIKDDQVRERRLPVSLEKDDLEARREEARAATALAQEHNKRVRAAWAEYISAQSNWWVKANAVAERAEQTVARSRPSQAAGVISPQELEDLERGLDWARSCERAAKASFDLAVALSASKGDLAVSTNPKANVR